MFAVVVGIRHRRMEIAHTRDRDKNVATASETLPLHRPIDTLTDIHQTGMSQSITLL